MYWYIVVECVLRGVVRNIGYFKLKLVVDGVVVFCIGKIVGLFIVWFNDGGCVSVVWRIKWGFVLGVVVFV